MKLTWTANFVSAVFSLADSDSTLAETEKQQQILRQEFNIHPNGDTGKCIGVSGGVLAAGSAVTIFDCNGTASQKWARYDAAGFHSSPIFVTNPASNKRFCMTVADSIHTFTNGAKLRLKECESTETPTSWTLYYEELFWKPYAYDGYSPDIRFYPRGSSNSINMCIDLTDGSKENRNVLQLWQCAPDGQATYQNQIWTWTAL